MTTLTARLHGVRTPAAALLAALSAGVMLSAVAFDSGQVASVLQAVAGDSTVHELFHDARHMLGFPCH
jgi:hypothetical protein